MMPLTNVNEEEYIICQKRGHQPENKVYTSNPPQYKCKWCGVFYRHESTVKEVGVKWGK